MADILQFPDIYVDPQDPEEDMRRAQRAWQQEVVDPLTESSEERHHRHIELLKKIYGDDNDK